MYIVTATQVQGKETIDNYSMVSDSLPKIVNMMIQSISMLVPSDYTQFNKEMIELIVNPYLLLDNEYYYILECGNVVNFEINKIDVL